MEPAPFPCLPMDNFLIPFALFTGGKNLGKIILYTLLVVQMAGRQGGKADDGVHRGADIVGHTGKEGALGTVGVFGGGNGIRKCPVQLLVGSAVR